MVSGMIFILWWAMGSYGCDWLRYIQAENVHPWLGEASKTHGIEKNTCNFESFSPDFQESFTCVSRYNPKRRIHDHQRSWLFLIHQLFLFLFRILFFSLQALGCETHFSPVRCDELHASLADCEEIRTQELRQAQHDAELAQRKRQQLLLALEVGQKCQKSIWIHVNWWLNWWQILQKKNEGWQSN